MSNPVVVSTTPSIGATDVVLGSTITVAFDQIIDHSSVNNSTFSLTGPGDTQAITPLQLINKDLSVLNGREYISGVFSFVDSNNQTTVTFNPSRPLQPNAQYTVLLVGVGALIVIDSIKNPAGEPLNANYQWTFSTGNLNTKTPPIQSPISVINTVLDPKSIKVKVNGVNPGDYLNSDIESGTVIQLIFPVAINTNSFDPTDILLSLEQFLGDPTVRLASTLTPEVSVLGNVITITLQG